MVTLVKARRATETAAGARAILTRAGGAIGARNAGLVIVLGVLLIILAVEAPFYVTIDNLTIVGLQMTTVGIISIGTAYLLISGNVDLSIGSLFGLVAVLAAMFAKSVPVPVAMAAGIAVAGAIGLANGWLVWRIRVSPIIITLGSLTLLHGVALLVTEGVSVQDVPRSFAWLGRTRAFDVPTAMWVFVALALAAYFVLSQTTIGRHLYAAGGNREATETAAVKVRRLVLGAFVFNGILVGVAAVLASSRFATATPLFGTGLELDVLTAVILGGVAFSGGEGSLLGVALAVALLGVLDSGLVALGIDPFYSNIVKGGVLIVAVGIEQLSREQRDRHRRALAMRERREENVRMRLPAESDER